MDDEVYLKVARTRVMFSVIHVIFVYYVFWSDFECTPTVQLSKRCEYYAVEGGQLSLLMETHLLKLKCL